MSVPTADQFLMGGGIPSAKFDNIGDIARGKITQEPEVRQQTDLKDGTPQFWDDGRPKMQLVVTIQTDLRDDVDDDGQRRIYVKGKYLTEAIREAVKGAGAKGLEVGGTLAVKFTGEGPQAKKGFNPPKLYAAQYERPVSRGQQDFFGGAQAQPEQQTPPASFNEAFSAPPTRGADPWSTPATTGGNGLIQGAEPPF